MKTQLNHFRLLLIGLLTLLPIGLEAQQLVKEYPLDKDGKVLISASSSNVQLEYWDKNTVSVSASIEGDYDKETRKILFEQWGVKTQGDGEVVMISAGASQWKGETRNRYVIRERGKAYEIITPDVPLPPVSPIPPAPPVPPMPPMDIHVNVPQTPDLPKMPQWPFSEEDDISVKWGDDIMKGVMYDTSIDFDKGAYEKNKQKYLDQLNKRFGTKVTTTQVDQWLQKVEKWMESIESTMEDWSKDFELQMEKDFGPDFEAKMEAWGEQFGKEFASKIEAWGEEYGENMEEWVEQFEEDFAPQLKKLEKNIEENLTPYLEELTDKIEKSIEHRQLSEERIAQLEARGERMAERIKKRAEVSKARAKARKAEREARQKEIVVRRLESRDPSTAHKYLALRSNSDDKKLIVKVPRNAKVELDVRYGSLQLKNAHNLQAHLNYTELQANHISGADTQLTISQTPVEVVHWEEGRLELNFADECRIKEVTNLSLESNTSDVFIGSIKENAWLNGSFGQLKIAEVDDQFKSIELTLENTEASLSLPKTAFDLYYRGIHSNWEPSTALTVDKTSMGNQEIIKGYHKSNSNRRSISINARYSDFELN